MSDSTGPKFYIAENCNRLITSNGIDFEFQPVEYFGGCWRGVFLTDNPTAHAALGKLVANPRNAIREVSQEDFEKVIKKKVPDAVRNYAPVLPTKQVIVVDAPTPEPQAIVPGKVIVEHPAPIEPKIEITSEPLKTVDDALVVGAVSVLRDAKARLS